MVTPSPREARVRRVRPFAVDAGALTRQVVAMVDEVGSDLVHTHWSSAIGWAGVAAARQRGLPVVAEVRFDLAGAVTAQTARLRPELAKTALEAGAASPLRTTSASGRRGGRRRPVPGLPA